MPASQDGRLIAVGLIRKVLVVIGDAQAGSRGELPRAVAIEMQRNHEMRTGPMARRSNDGSMHTAGPVMGTVRKAQRFLTLLVLALALSVACGNVSAAGTMPIELGTAADFGALADAAISGSGRVEGDVGSGTGAIAPAITSTGTIYPTGDAAVLTALNDFASAYNEGRNRPYDVLLSAAAFELGGSTLTPGVYRIGAAATLASPVTLDAEGDPDAVFIIQIVGALGATAAVGNVVLANDAQSRNIFWIVDGAVSMGADTHMEGTVLGGAAVSFGAGTTLSGRAMSGSSAGTIALATIISAPPLPPVPVGGRVWLDTSDEGIQDPMETTGFPNLPVALLQIVADGLPVELGAAADFGALAGGAVSGTGSVDGDVGSGTGAIAPAITSTGTIYATGDAVVMTALDDFAAAYSEAMNRPGVLLSAAAYELGGSTLTPGAHKIGGAATLATPLTLDAEGDPDAVFVMQIVGAFSTTAATGNVVLANAAQSRNVFWAVEGAVSIGANAHMEGTLLGGAAITFGAGATLNGRALAGTTAGTVALATTAISVVPGTPPVEQPPSNVVASTVTDTNGNYQFAEVQPPGTYLIRWDLSTLSTTDFAVTAANQGGDDALDSDGVTGDVGEFVYTAEMDVLGGTTYLDVDLGLIVITIYTVAVSANPAEGGNVGGGGSYNHGATVTVTAAANTGYSFANWTEGGVEVSTNASYQFTAESNRTLVAHFALNIYTLNYTAGPHGSISGDSAQTVEHGASGTAVTAVPGAGYSFVQWDDAVTANPRTDSDIIADLSVTAEFENASPSIAAILDQSMLEDSGLQPLTIHVADADSDPATLAVTATSSEPTLLADPAVNAGDLANERVLGLRPAADANGELTIIVTVTDTLGASAQGSFTISILSVNDAPSLSVMTLPTHPAASIGPQMIADFATFNAGPPSEQASQAVDAYLVDSIVDADGILAADSLAISTEGALSYTLTGVGGAATITARVRDDGGTANGGQNTSPPVQFTIAVTPGADLQIAKDNGRAWLTQGETTVYAIVVANAGPNSVIGARITDMLPATLINGSWMCLQARSTATCPSPDASDADLDALIDLGVDEFLRFDVLAEVNAELGAVVSNTATVTVPDGVTAIDPHNDSATDADPVLQLGIFVDGFEAAAPSRLTVPGAVAAMPGK